MTIWSALAGCTDGGAPAGDDDDGPASIPHSAELPPPPETTPAPFSDVAWSLDPAHPTLVRVTWSQSEPAAVHAEFSPGPGAWAGSPVRELGPGPHEEWLAGVPYATQVPFHLVADTATGTVTTADFTARTGAWPPGLQPPESVTGDGWDPAVPWILLSLSPENGDFGGRWWAMIVDRAGRVVWAERAAPDRMTMHPRLTWDERAVLLDQNSFWAAFDHGLGSTIRRTTLEGRQTHAFSTPGLHHPFAPMPDGAVVYGAISTDGHDEDLVRVDPDTDARTVVWNCQEWLATLALSEPQYCTSNTVNYDEPSDTWLFSFYSSETVVEIGAGGRVRRYFGHLPGAWRFDPPGSAFWWQHGGHYLPDGNFVTSTHDAEVATEILVREYAVDEAARTLRQVWTMDEGDGLWGIEYNQMGEVARLPGGNTLHNLGTYPRIREGTPDGRVVWDLSFPIEADLGRTTPIRDLYALLAPRE